MPKEVSLFATNLKTLREFNGETQTNLALKIGVSTDLISKYEKAERVPKEDRLNKISEHYNIPINILLSQEITKEYLKNRTECINDALNDFSDLIYLNLTSDATNTDPLFIEACDCYNRLVESDIPIESMLVKCKNLFYESFKQTKSVESAANTIALIIYEYNFKTISQPLLRKFIFENPIYLKDFEEQKRNPSFTKDFLKENGKMFNKCLLRLKRNSKTSEIADYYLALKYIHGLIDNNEPFELNNKIGIFMMYEFYTLKNKYAINYIETISKLYSNV